MVAPANVSSRTFEATDLAYIAVFAALIAAFSQISIALGPVPFTLQTLAVALCGLCLGPWRGLAAVALWLLVGLAGLPVFAGGNAGVSVLLRPSGGYIISFLVSVVLVGLMTQYGRRFSNPMITAGWWYVVLLINRFVIVLPLGVAWLARTQDTSFQAAMWSWDAPFWLWDALKNAVAVVVAVAVHKAFPRLFAK